LITDVGAQASLRAVAGQQVGVASHIAVGVGDTAATATDQRLELETRRVEIDSVSIDYANEYVIYKCTLPTDFIGKVYETALVNSPVSVNTIVTDFASDGVEWSGGSANSTYTRIGSESLRSNPATSATDNISATVSASLSDVDEIVVAYHVVTAPASMSIRLRTDGSNYYYASLPTGTGYHIERISVASGLSVTGAPSSLNSVEVVVTSTAGASADVHFDGLVTSTGQDSGSLTARHVLSTPKAATADRVLEIEYSLVVSV
jgi:hypothetical protein